MRIHTEFFVKISVGYSSVKYGGYFSSFCIAFYEELGCVLRCFALRFTKQYKVKHRRNVCISIWNQLRFYIEMHEKLNILPSLYDV
jgi:hypothetical protein